MTVLVTGYEPFGDFESNPSETVATELDGHTVADEDVVGAVVPVEYDRTSDEIAALVADYDPSVVVCTGLAGGEAGIRIERVGINVNDCVGTPDNAGDEPRDERIDDGPAAYFASLPCTRIVEGLLDAGIPARLSNTAGTHLCNNALYTTRHLAEREGLDLRSGFVHLPFSPEQAARQAAENESVAGGSVPPSLPITLQVDAVERVIETTLSA